MRLLIFGASGFIGSRLAQYATSCGHEVSAFSRSGFVPGFAGECTKWTFGAHWQAPHIQGADCAIHLAHDFGGAEGAQLTIKETLATVSRLRAEGIRRQIFFSSYSAGAHATSLYGLTKLAIERQLEGASDVVILRPGLVIGSGGIYGRMREFSKRLPLIPLPNGGYGRVPVIDVNRLCAETVRIATDSSLSREFNVFEPLSRSLRQLILEAAAEVGHKPIIIPVPTSLIALGLRVAAMLRLPLPISEDNLAGFMANQDANHISSLRD